MSIFKKDYNLLNGKGEDGITWITVNGAHIPIKDGESVEDAIEKHFGKKDKEEFPQNTDYEDILKKDKVKLAKNVNLLETNADKFYNAISYAKKLDDKNGWAVDIHSKSEYNNMQMRLTENGKAGVAVESNGNIVSVFNAKDSGHKGIAKQLLSEAVKMGGDRLDAYGAGLFDIYTKNGFEPVSWVQWNDEYAPPE